MAQNRAGFFVMTVMPTRYFSKEIPENPIRLSNGVPLRFEFLATEDTNLQAELDMAISRSVGGVVEINAAEYDELLKKKELPPQKPVPRAFPSHGPSSLPKRLADSAVAVESPRVGRGAFSTPARNQAPPEPLKVPVFKTVKASMV